MTKIITRVSLGGPIRIKCLGLYEECTGTESDKCNKIYKPCSSLPSISGLKVGLHEL